MNAYRQRFKTSLQRFRDHAIPCPPSTCVLWEGGGHRYGAFWHNGQNLSAHHAAWELFKGPVPDGMQVCHSCDVSLCVNPDHLFLGTQKDNRVDCARKGRAANGERNGNARFTSEQIQTIRNLHAVGVSRKELSIQFDTSKTQIGFIVTRQIWREL